MTTTKQTKRTIITKTTKSRKQPKMETIKLNKHTIQEDVTSFARKLITKLADEHGFDAHDAFEQWMSGVEVELTLTKPKKPKHVKPAFVLPWCGQIMSGFCEGIRFYKGTMSQCHNAKPDDGNLCKTCQDSGKYGTVHDRDSEEWTEEHGKRVANYVTILKKLDKTQDEAIDEAAKFGIELPESVFEEREPVRRSKGKKSADDDEEADAGSDSEPETKPKTKTKKGGKRGRPAKKAKPATTEPTPDAVATLVSEAGDVSEDDETEVEPIDGTEFFKTSDGTVVDGEGNIIGKYEDGEIVFNSSEAEDSE